MTPSALTSDRLHRLERENRRFKQLFLLLFVALGALPLLASAGDDTPDDAHFRIVTASKFQVRDPRTDTVRATLAHQTTAGGWAGLTLWDEAGNPRAKLELWEDGRTHLLMMDAERRELSRVSVSPDGRPEIAIAGEVVHTGTQPSHDGSR